jgi:hypothetical protein
VAEASTLISKCSWRLRAGARRACREVLARVPKAELVLIYMERVRKNATQSATTSQPVYNVAGQYVDFAGSKQLTFQGSPFLPGDAQYSYVVKHGSVGVSGAVFTFGAIGSTQMASLLVDYNKLKYNYYTLSFDNPVLIFRL